MFIPCTTDELNALGWERLDVILVTGDAYIDSPSCGISVIGHVLMDAGFKVGIISQPADNTDDITRLGEPALFWGVSSGAVDSMVSNYNADRSRRRHDDLTAGGKNNARPDRACIAYTGLIRRYFKNTVPIVLGGIEASLRRIVHYDYWQNAIRRSILFDSKADIIVYGMGELAILSLAQKLSDGEDYRSVPGICFISNEYPPDALEIPSFEETVSDPDIFSRMFLFFYANAGSGRLAQKHGARFLVHNPPSRNLTPDELDHIYELPYEREAHPLCREKGEVRALETIRFSITTHRGCFAACNFCSISLHQGRHIISRSEESIVREAVSITERPMFKGVVNDVGGASANMYGMGCSMEKGCANMECLAQEPCRSLHVDHSRLIKLLVRLGAIPQIKRLFVASGIRHDLILADKKNGETYLKKLIDSHISGYMRVAPEHSEEKILELMGKPHFDKFAAFKSLFEKTVEGKKTGLSYYLMAAHPGCSLEDMDSLCQALGVEKKPLPGSVQIFTPTPSTISTLMYYTGKDINGDAVFIEREMGKKLKQKKRVKVLY
ncbi:MAG: YgiQ family radical SAM protein [Leptospirales bacterium]|nr:YgiQ family radical SAM protein [Leptospirales bacterium]